MKISMMHCDKGVDFLTMRIVVTLILAAALIAISSTYVNEYLAGASRDMARAEAGRIAELARAEYVDGCPDIGDGQTIDIHVPAGVNRIIFGGVRYGNSSIGRNANAYFIEYTDGRIETFISDAKFAYGDQSNHTVIDRPVVLYPGEYTLNTRAMKVNDMIETTIFGGSPC